MESQPQLLSISLHQLFYTYSQNSRTGDVKLFVTLEHDVTVTFVMSQVGGAYSGRQAAVFHQWSQVAHGSGFLKELKR